MQRNSVIFAVPLKFIFQVGGQPAKELNSFFIRYSFIAECSMIVFSAQDLNTNRIPYNLEKEERHMYPGELQR